MSTPAYLIDGAEDLKREWFENIERIGITAGASAPEVLVRGVIEQLRVGCHRHGRAGRATGERHVLHAEGVTGEAGVSG